MTWIPGRAVVAGVVVAALGMLAMSCDGAERDERPRDPTARFGAGRSDQAPESRSVALSIGASRVPAQLLRDASESWELETDEEILVVRSDDEAAIDRLCMAEVPLVGTTRRLRREERAICRANGVQLTTVPVGYQALVVAANEELALECLTMDELRRLWRAGSPVVTLADLRPGLPNRAPLLVGAQPGTSAFDLFTKRVTGAAGLRGDYLPAEDLAVFRERLVGRERAVGFYQLGGLVPLPPEGMTLVAVNAGRGCVHPSRATVRSGRYRALARPVYLHLDRSAVERRRDLRSYLEALFRSYDQHASTAGALIPLEPDRARRSARALGV